MTPLPRNFRHFLQLSAVQTRWNCVGSKSRCAQSFAQIGRAPRTDPGNKLVEPNRRTAAAAASAFERAASGEVYASKPKYPTQAIRRERSTFDPPDFGVMAQSEILFEGRDITTLRTGSPEDGLQMERERGTC